MNFSSISLFSFPRSCCPLTVCTVRHKRVVLLPSSREPFPVLPAGRFLRPTHCGLWFPFHLGSVPSFPDAAWSSSHTALTFSLRLIWCHGLHLVPEPIGCPTEPRYLWDAPPWGSPPEHLLLEMPSCLNLHGLLLPSLGIRAALGPRTAFLRENHPKSLPAITCGPQPQKISDLKGPKQ